MNFQNLESFLVLAEEGSVTRAAERLHVSQQALSGLLARLEKEAGSPLFFRRSGLELTYAGICLQRAAIQILDIQRPPTGSTGILTGSAIGLAVRLSLRTRLTLIRLALIRKP